MPLHHFLLLIAVSLYALPGLSRARAETWNEPFEGPDISWRDAGGDGTYRIDKHVRVQQGAHRGQGCERLTVSGGDGTYVYISHEIVASRVIDELQPSVWIKSDRAGLQILARMVLPRSRDPRTGKPIVALLRGTGYTQAGSWQQLKIDDLPLLVERELRALRARYGPSVDAREATIDRVLLNVYGGPGLTNVTIDDLEVTGSVGAPAVEGAVLPATAPAATVRGASLSSAAPASPGMPPMGAEPAAMGEAPPVALSGSGLLVGGKPFFPRVIEHRGEPLVKLQSLGFNVVKVSTVVTPQLSQEASRLGLWLIGPPPPSMELTSRGASFTGKKLGSEFDAVLVWDLGQGLSTRELEANRNWAKAVRAADPRSRPLLCAPDSELRAYSRQCDMLVTHRDPLGGSQQLTDYTAWLRGRAQLARPGTPLWTGIQTQPTPQIVEQFAVLCPGQPTLCRVQDEQVRLLVYSALAAGARGMYFRSLTALDAPDLDTRRRGALLELINLELELLEPWSSAGAFVTTASSNDAQVSGAVLQTERARLLLPLIGGVNGQFALGAPATNPLAFVVPGVPESHEAYELNPANFRPLPQKRVAGGIRVTLGDGQRESFVVLTQDALVINTLTRRVAKFRRRAAELQRELTALDFADAEGLEHRMAAVGRSMAWTRSFFAAAQASIRQADAYFTATDFANAIAQARIAADNVRQIERGYWDKNSLQLGPPISSPLALGPLTIAEQVRFAAEMKAAPRGPNRLAGGDFEDLGVMQRAGWRHFQHPQSGIATDVELSPEAPHGGRFSLKLSAKAADVDKAPGQVETPPLWITSAPVNVEPGQVAIIHGWARVAKPLVGSVDGLTIIDSCGGEALAERIVTSAGWQEFTVYRACPRSGPLSVTFALSGMGEACLDDVTIQAAPRGPAAPVQQAAQSQPAGAVR